MSNKAAIVVSCLLLLGVILAGALLWNQMPEQMASHWNEQDIVNGYTSKFWGLFMVPLMMVGFTLLFLAIPAIDPLKKNIQEFRGLFNIFIVLFNLYMAYIHALTVAWNLGYTGFRMGAAMTPAIGFLFILIGLVLRKAKRNYFIGIRTPWTLASDKVWAETHKLGGWLFVAAGIIAFFGVIFPDQAFYLLIIPAIASAVFTFVYSYLLYRRLEER